jgi:hypothetical protein
MRVLIAALVVSLILPAAVQAQAVPPAADVWRTFAGQITVGSQLDVRLIDGAKFRATLISAGDAGLLLQPKTRRPVPVQQVPYDVVASLEVPGKGIGAGKAAAIGVAVGAGAFWAMVGIALAVWSD